MPLWFYRHCVAGGEMVIRKTKLCVDQPDTLTKTSGLNWQTHDYIKTGERNIQ